MNKKKSDNLSYIFGLDDEKATSRVAFHIDDKLSVKIGELAENSRITRARLINDALNSFVSKGQADEGMFLRSDSTNKPKNKKRLQSTSMPRVFLSHNHKDKRFVRNLGKKLQNSGIQVWIDEAEIMHGHSLIETLRDAIDSVDLLIAVISPASIASSWVQKEIDIAMNAEIKSKRIRVIPVLRKGTELPGFLEGKMYADFTTPYRQKKNMTKLIESIHALAK